MSNDRGTEEEILVRPPGRLATAALVLGVLATLVPGLWAYIAPSHFHSVVAPWAPLGEHFLRDGGAFQVGIGTSVVAALFIRDGITVALSGLSMATLLHAVSHAIDADYRTATILAMAGLFFATALVARRRSAA
jgi:uncharacterized protein YjeT (DUF2065 family)